ncbi:hypothetical protein V5O48_017455, partial [Marasmius crinis-equi]
MEPTITRKQTLQSRIWDNRRRIGCLSAILAIASGGFGVIATNTQEIHSLTAGFGTVASICSFVAGSIGLYELISKRSDKKSDDLDRDLEQGPDHNSFELTPRLPSTVGNGPVDDAGTSEVVVTGIQRQTFDSVGGNNTELRRRRSSFAGESAEK